MTVYNYQKIQPNQQLIFNQDTGDLVGIKNPHANGDDLNLSVPNGSEIVGFIQAGTGAVARTAQSKMRDTVSVKDFGAVGDGVSDDTSSIQASINSGQAVYFPSGTYKISSALLIPSDCDLYSYGATIVLASGSNSHMLRVVSTASNVTISGFYIDGNSANNTGGYGITNGSGGGTNITINQCTVINASSLGMYFGNCTTLLVKDCIVTGSGDDGIAAAGTDIRLIGNYISTSTGHGIDILGVGGGDSYHVELSGNYSTGNTLSGINCGHTNSYVTINGNHCWANGTHGVGATGILKYATITANVCWGNSSVVGNADNITAYNSSNTDITVTGNSCYGGNNNGIHIGGNNIVIMGNIVDSPLYHGIAAQPNTGSSRCATISGNTIRSAGYSGIWLKSTQDATISGNTISNSGNHGILLEACDFVSVSGNTVRSSFGRGIINSTATTHCSITGNTIVSNGSHGIDLSNLTTSVISSNVIYNNTGWGITPGGTEGDNAVFANYVKGNVSGQIDALNVTTMVNNNSVSGSKNVASAATLTLNNSGSNFYVTGTTNITSISASWTGRLVVLRFDDVLTVTDGGNLDLAGNFVTTFKDTLTLMYDGTVWTEVSRSIN